MLLRDAEPSGRIAFAFPDMPRYRDLLRRTAVSLRALDVEAVLVAEDGAVRWVDPTQLPAPSERGASSTAPAATAAPRRVGAHAGLTLHEVMVAVLRGAPSGSYPLTTSPPRSSIASFIECATVAPSPSAKSMRELGTTRTCSM